MTIPAAASEGIISTPAQHTPLPWRAYEHPAIDYRPCLIITADGGSAIAMLDGGGPKRAIGKAEERANAEFIVRACNGHEGLLAALKLAAGHIEHMAAFFGGKGLGYSFESLGEDMPGIRAAIALATGTAPRTDDALTR